MSTQHGYRALGRWHDIILLPLSAADSSGAPRAMSGRRALRGGAIATAARPSADVEAIANVVRQSKVLSSRIDDPEKLAVVQGSVPARRAAAGPGAVRRSPISTYGAMTLATQTVIAEGLRRADLDAAEKFGATVLRKSSTAKRCCASTPLIASSVWWVCSCRATWGR